MTLLINPHLRGRESPSSSWHQPIACPHYLDHPFTRHRERPLTQCHSLLRSATSLHNVRVHRDPIRIASLLTSITEGRMAFDADAVARRLKTAPRLGHPKNLTCHRSTDTLPTTATARRHRAPEAAAPPLSASASASMSSVDLQSVEPSAGEEKKTRPNGFPSIPLVPTARRSVVSWAGMAVSGAQSRLRFIQQLCFAHFLFFREGSIAAFCPSMSRQHPHEPCPSPAGRSHLCGNRYPPLHSNVTSPFFYHVMIGVQCIENGLARSAPRLCSP